MEPHELERLRRSVAMLPPGHSAGALTKEAAEQLLEEVAAARAETKRYRWAMAKIQSILEALDGPGVGAVASDPERDGGR